MTVRSTLLALSLMACVAPFADAQNESPLKKKDRISIIGNARGNSRSGATPGFAVNAPCRGFFLPCVLV